MTNSDNQHDKHIDVIEMLPWFANGSLEEHERQRVQQVIDTCVACKNELEQLQLLQRSVASAEIAVPAAAPGLRSMMSRIESENAVVDPDRSLRTQRLTDWFADWFNPALGMAIAASLVLVVVILNQDSGSQAGATYSVLSSEKSDSGVRFLVKMSDATSPVDTQSLLEAALQTDNLRVEASTNNSYIVVIPDTLVESRIKQSRVKTVADMQNQLQGVAQVLDAELVP